MKLYQRIENLRVGTRIWLLAGAFAVTTLLVLAVNLFATHTLDTVRALVAGEGMWSKAQRDASYALARYATTCDERDYAAFVDNLRVPLADHEARLELEKPDPDLDKTDRAFIAGRNDPSEVRSLATFLLRFRGIEYVDRATRAWTRGDELIAELQRLGEHLHAQLRSGTVPAKELEAERREIDRLNVALSGLEEEFSAALGEGARWLQGIVTWLMIASAALCLVIGLVVARAISRSIMRGVAQLREGTVRVADGDLAYRIDATTSNELGELASAFDTMTANLERAVREGHEIAEQLADAQAISHVGSWKWDTRSERITWSDELCRIYGIDPRDAPSCYAGIRDMVMPEDAALVREAVRETRETGNPFVCEYRIRRADGAIRILHARGRAVRDADGRVTVLEGTAQDITERKEMERNLMFSQRLASVGTLAGGVAHEINNPLAYVLENVRAVADDLSNGTLQTPTELRKAIDILREAQGGAERVRQIVRGLSSFSRGDEERRTHVDVRSTLDIAIKIAGNEIRHRASLVRDFGDVHAVIADEPRLSQVFVNLLVNAAQAIGEGHRDRSVIRVVTRMVDSSVVVEVHDTGGGIPEAIRSRIFDPFFTTKPIGQGTGLGLAISHGIVTSLGGAITVESEVGKGSLFRVTLAAAAPLPPAATPEPPRAEVTPIITMAPAARARILIVDDDPLVRRAVARGLERLHDVVVAGGGQDGLMRVTSDEPYDIIFCDLMMPDMTGMDLHAELARTSPVDAAKMVFITGGAFTPRAQQFLDTTTNLWIEKPFNAAQLIRVVAERTRPALSAP